MYCLDLVAFVFSGCLAQVLTCMFLLDYLMDQGTLYFYAALNRKQRSSEREIARDAAAIIGTEAAATYACSCICLGWRGIAGMAA